MVNNELINDYLDRFDEMPPKYISISTDDEDYLRLVATALVEDRKIDSKYKSKYKRATLWNYETNNSGGCSSCFA